MPDRRRRFGFRSRGRGYGSVGIKVGSLERGLGAGNRCPAGSLLVFCAWVVFVVAGASFSNCQSSSTRPCPPHPDRCPGGAFKTIQMVAVVAAILVGVGALAAVPGLLAVRARRRWCWSVSRHVNRATAVTAVTVVSSIGLVGWANSLSYAERNGGSSLYGLAFAVGTFSLSRHWRRTVVAVVVGSGWSWLDPCWRSRRACDRGDRRNGHDRDRHRNLVGGHGGRRALVSPWNNVRDPRLSV